MGGIQGGETSHYEPATTNLLDILNGDSPFKNYHVRVILIIAEIVSSLFSKGWPSRVRHSNDCWQYVGMAGITKLQACHYPKVLLCIRRQ